MMNKKNIQLTIVLTSRVCSSNWATYFRINFSLLYSINFLSRIFCFYFDLRRGKHRKSKNVDVLALLFWSDQYLIGYYTKNQFLRIVYEKTPNFHPYIFILEWTLNRHPHSRQTSGIFLTVFFLILEQCIHLLKTINFGFLVFVDSAILNQ